MHQEKRRNGNHWLPSMNKLADLSVIHDQKCKHENKMTNCGHMRRNGGKEVSCPRNALMVAVNAKLIAKK
jgi:hypothetical protein